MSDETFHYHSGEGRNNFSNWIRDVVGDEKLSKDLSKAKSHIQFVIVRGRSPEAIPVACYG